MREWGPASLVWAAAAQRSHPPLPARSAYNATASAPSNTTVTWFSLVASLAAGVLVQAGAAGVGAMNRNATERLGRSGQRRRLLIE